MSSCSNQLGSEVFFLKKAKNTLSIFLSDTKKKCLQQQESIYDQRQFISELKKWKLLKKEKKLITKKVPKKENKSW